MKNTLLDLNNHLFAQIERLSDEELSEEQLEKEINRSRAITSVSAQIIANGTLALKAEEYKHNTCFGEDVEIPQFLEGGKKCITDSQQKKKNG